MTVAPMMPIATYSIAGLVTISRDGRKPPSIAATGGAAAAICTAKQPAITISSAMMKASRKRKPWFISSSSRNASSAVISAPAINGMPNSSCSAIAVPITSARSQAMIAVSQASHSAKLTGRGIAVAARLGQIAPGDDAEPRRQRLQQDRHQVGQQDDREQRVAEP